MTGRNLHVMGWREDTLALLDTGGREEALHRSRS